MSTISENTIAESLKIILVKEGLNISKLATKMGVSNTTLYSKFKRGNFTTKDLDSICKVLNISYRVTFTIEDNKESK